MCLSVLAGFLQQVGLAVYGGALVVFALLLGLGPRLTSLEPQSFDRVYRASGPIAGLGLGLLILGGALWHYELHGAFVWGCASPADRLECVRDLVFFSLWVSYTWREVWTLEPLRRLDGIGGPSDLPAYLRARKRLLRHLAINACLFLLVLALGAWEAVVRGQYIGG